MTEVIKVEDCGENIGNYDVPIYKAILIPKNATNGDMIETMFPQLKIRILPDMVIVFGEDYSFQHHYPIEWWNASYTIESGVEEYGKV